MQVIATTIKAAALALTLTCLCASITGAGATDRLQGLTKPQRIEAPSDAQVVALVDESMRLFMTSVREKSMQTFRNHVSVQFQKHSVAQFDEAFKSFFSAVTGDPLAGKSPIFKARPFIDSNGWLVIEGFYPTAPHLLKFHLRYVAEGLGWKVLGIHVSSKDPNAPPTSEGAPRPAKRTDA